MIPIPVFAFLYGLSIPESPIFLNQVILIMLVINVNVYQIFYTFTPIVSIIKWLEFLGLPWFGWFYFSQFVAADIWQKSIEPGGRLQPDWDRTRRKEGGWKIFCSLVHFNQLIIYHLTCLPSKLYYNMPLDFVIRAFGTHAIWLTPPPLIWWVHVR